MLKSFASLSLAVSTAYAVQFSNNLEDEIAGYHHWPDTRCCRMYTEPNFLGWYRDFCTEANTHPGSNPTLALWDDPTDAQYFDRQMSSWKCGAGVAVKFCFGDAIVHTMSNDIIWEDEIYSAFQRGTECRHSQSESGRALGYNKDISAANPSHDNKVRSVVLMPYDPQEFPMIQVYSGTNCTGYSALAYKDLDQYASVLVPDGIIRSFSQPPATRVAFFSEDSYQGKSIESDNESDNQICVTITHADRPQEPWIPNSVKIRLLEVN